MTQTKLKRNKIASVISPLIGCIFVGIFGTMCLIFIAALDGVFNLSGPHADLFERARSTNNAWIMGVMGTISGMVVALFVFFLFYPFALAVWAPTLGRLPHRKIVKLKPYVKRGGLVGAALCGIMAALMIHIWVGATDSLNWEDTVDVDKETFEPIQLTLSALLTGLVAGSVIGIATGWVHFMILRPDRQLGVIQGETISVFD